MLGMLGAMTAMLVLVVMLELVLRMLPVVSGLHRQTPRSPSASARLLPDSRYTWSIGWDMRNVVQGRTNAMGFVSPHEYTPDKRAVALLGDSYVEAHMLRYDESLAGHLNARWNGLAYAFNFGLSGASLPHYLGIAREMGSQFTFEAAIVVISPGDYAGGFEGKSGLYKWHEDPERHLVKLVPETQRGAFRQFARELALLRYVRANLKLGSRQLLTTASEACVPQTLSGKDHERLATYLDALQRALRLPPDKVVLVFNSPTSHIYERVDRNREASEHCPDLDANARAELRQLAALRGMRIVDVAQVLESHYRAHRRQLDFRPLDGHWNGLAAGAVANAIVHALELRDVRVLRTASPG
jgi:hypothetical protein